MVYRRNGSANPRGELGSHLENPSRVGSDGLTEFAMYLGVQGNGIQLADKTPPIL
jgi:hypothetical protein